MYSNGGLIIPRPHDKSLCYIGGETRLLTMDRDTTLLELTRRISKTLTRSTSPSYSFTLKYQLPSHDLDSLVSLTNEEDFENMIEEYERLNSLSRIRLFVFRTNAESICLVTSDDWFVEVLNGGGLGVSNSSSVNWLVNLDDEIYVQEKLEVHQKCHSVPDSTMMETSSSSFGSASSSPSVANLRIQEVFSLDHSILRYIGNESFFYSFVLRIITHHVSMVG